MSQNYDLGDSTTSGESTTSRMSTQSSAFSSSFQGNTFNVPPCDLPHIQISNTEMDDSIQVIRTERFDQETHMRHSNAP